MNTMMLNIDKFKKLRLSGMAEAYENQMQSVDEQALSFEQRLSLLLEHELTTRENRRLARLLKQAKLKYSEACIENIQYKVSRKLDKKLIMSLAECQWIRNKQGLIISGATGCGKTYLACALGTQAAREGLSVLYKRIPRLMEEFQVAHADGSLPKLRQKLAKADLLILDDWGLSPLTDMAKHDLLEIMDDRSGTSSTLVTSQLPISKWHEYINEPTLADAILDRLIHSSHKLDLKGESMRKLNKL